MFTIYFFYIAYISATECLMCRLTDSLSIKDGVYLINQLLNSNLHFTTNKALHKCNNFDTPMVLQHFLRVNHISILSLYFLVNTGKEDNLKCRYITSIGCRL